MQRHGSTRCSLRAVVTRGFVASALGLAMLTGCAGSGASDQDRSRAAAQCRSDWHRLAADHETRAKATHPSDLPARWQALAAAASYRETTTTGDCSVELGAARATADQIRALTLRLRPYDLVWAHTDRSPAVVSALGADLTRKVRRHLRSAFAVLERTAPAAAVDMDAGWKTADTIDLDEPARVRELLSDMGFLASDSPTYLRGHAALVRLDRLLRLSRR